ncbi:MAG: hypothetical protein ACI8WM_002073 [Burkholderiaceae bacterium]|jgi:hypothetical protein
MMHIFFRPACLLTTLALTGCISTTPYYDQHFGEAVSKLNAMQILNPAAATNTDPVAGMGGREARSAYADYQKSFVTPVPQPGSLTIGVGAR